MKNANELAQMLRGYSGSEQIYRHSLNPRFNYTEGARAFFQNAGQGAYWLSDILATEPKVASGVREHGFSVLVLHASEGKATLKLARDASEKKDGSGKTTGYEMDGVFFERNIDMTDCPDGLWKFYLCFTQAGNAKVVLCMLSSEY